MEYASNGKGNLGVTLGAIGTGLGVLNGGLGSLFGGWGNGCSENTPAWYAAMNMLYSDYCAVAREYGVDRPDYYAKMARAFLMDRDGGGAEKKIAAYYRCVAAER